MKLSIVVPTYKPHDIRPLLSGLEQQSDQEFEVVVVENGSKKKSLTRQLESCKLNLEIVYIHEYAPGLNRARNLGVVASSGSHIALIDDDCCPESDWVCTIKEAHKQQPAAGVIGGRVLLSYEQPPPFWLNSEFRRSLAELDYGEELKALGRWQHLVGANLSFTRAVFDEVGGFQEGLGLKGDEVIIRANDEAEFIQKACMRGLPGAVYAGAAVVQHHVPSSRTQFDYLLKRRFGQGVSDIESDLLEAGIRKAVRSFYTQVFRSRWHLDELERDSTALSQDEAIELKWRGVLARVIYLLGARERLLSSSPEYNVMKVMDKIENTAYLRGQKLASSETFGDGKASTTELLQRILYDVRPSVSPFTRVAMAAGAASHDLDTRLQPMDAAPDRI